jgi:hypothetical protein
MLVPVEILAGACFVAADGVHRGGATSDRPRLAFTNQYCEPWGGRRRTSS